MAFGINTVMLSLTDNVGLITLRTNQNIVTTESIIWSSFSKYWFDPLWRHQMETFSALLALCAGNSPGTPPPPERPVTRCFDVFVDLAWMNSWDWWFETPSCPLWRHYNAYLHQLIHMQVASEEHCVIIVVTIFNKKNNDVSRLSVFALHYHTNRRVHCIYYHGWTITSTTMWSNNNRAADIHSYSGTTVLYSCQSVWIMFKEWFNSYTHAYTPFGDCEPGKSHGFIISNLQ